MMSEGPTPGDLVKWLSAYPRLTGKTEKIIWWSVFKTYWLWPLVAVLVTETVWHTLFHYIFRWIEG